MFRVSDDFFFFYNQTLINTFQNFVTFDSSLVFMMLFVKVCPLTNSCAFQEQVYLYEDYMPFM